MIQDYAVEVVGASFEDRKRLVECLKYNNQSIYSRSEIQEKGVFPYSYFVSNASGEFWCGSEEDSTYTKIPIKEFLKKFGKPQINQLGVLCV